TQPVQYPGYLASAGDFLAAVMAPLDGALSAARVQTDGFLSAAMAPLDGALSAARVQTDGFLSAAMAQPQVAKPAYLA
ncbi:hypothetical protein, partial [Pantoea ananatis]|uniref:hypothetical protein n=1 Tax=Pantoea ananas TaxID=553 RepID=UPI0023AF66FF